MNVSFTVSFSLPPGATRAAAQEYVMEAVKNWSGGLEPPGAGLHHNGRANPNSKGDPMFNLDPNSVIVQVR